MLRCVLNKNPIMYLFIWSVSAVNRQKPKKWLGLLSFGRMSPWAKLTQFPPQLNIEDVGAKKAM